MEDRQTKIYNLILVTDETAGQVLLGYKKRGFGVNKWSGFGGKVNKGEDIVASVKRELFEESALIAESIVKVGILCFDSDTYSHVHEAHVFKVKRFSGTPTESDEMRPKWFPIESIPYDGMWKDFKFWWPLFTSDKLFTAFFMYRGLEEITSYKLMTVDDPKELKPLNEQNLS